MAIKMRMTVVAVNHLGLGEEEIRMRPSDKEENKELNETWSKENRQTDAEFNMMITVEAEKGQFKIGDEFDISWKAVPAPKA
jgi:ssRNA-specific RNase YbeY (16S rRNA maturation enzyme)